MMRVVTGSEVEVGVYLRGEAGRLVRARRAAQRRVDQSQGPRPVLIALIVKATGPPKLRKVSHPHELISI